MTRIQPNGRKGAGAVAALLLAGCAAGPGGGPVSSDPGPPRLAEPVDAGPAPPATAHPTPSAEPSATSARAAPAAETIALVYGPEPLWVALPDLWDRLRAGLALPAVDHPRIDGPLDWYASHPEYLARVVDRAAPFLHRILERVEARGMPTELALLPVVESAFRPFAYSHGRAAGIWQFIPGTGRRFGLKQNWWYDGRRDVIASTEAALDYLEDLHARFDGDWLLALAAYNTGAGNVQRAIRRNERRGRAMSFWDLALPRETRGYVPKLLAVSRVVAEPRRHGVRLRALPDAPQIAVVGVGSQIDLALAAELAGVSVETLYRLNPGFNRWATAPDGPHRLVLPIDRAEVFRGALAEVPASKRVRWTRHRVRAGETLSGLAGRYRTTVGVLRRVNGLRGHLIRVGQNLVVPVASREPAGYSLSAEQRRATLREIERRGRKTVHVVRPGDTLWEIARRYEVAVRTLARWNGMAPADPLHPGRKLVIWVPEREAALDLPRLNAAPPGALQAVRYRVRRGDSLSRIARRFRVSVADLRRWNTLPRGRYLQPGQALKLYVDVTKQTGRL